MDIPLANKTDVENAVAAARSAFDWGLFPTTHSGFLPLSQCRRGRSRRFWPLPVDKT